MSTQNRPRARNQDSEDLVETHVFQTLEYVDGAGAVVKVKGNGTEDEEVQVIHIGMGFNLPDGTDAEVVLFSGGSDTNYKLALMTIPHDKARKWKAGRGGVQHPLDPAKALEFNEKRAHLKEANCAIGNGGAFECKGDVTYIRGKKILFEVPPDIGTPEFEKTED